VRRLLAVARHSEEVQAMDITIRTLCDVARVLLMAALTGTLAACGADHARAAANEPSDGYETHALRYQGWIGGVSFPELAEDLGYLAPLKLSWVGNTISGPQDIQATLTGDVDFGAAFNGAIINLIAAKAPIVSVIGTSFVDAQNFSAFYTLADSRIRSPRDLIGKRVGMNTVGAHSEFMLREWLTRGGLSRDEIKQVTLVAIPPVNSEQTLRQRQLDVVTLGGILRDKALERGSLRALFSDYELFGSFSSASYVVTRRFLRANPKAARKFVEATARAIEWARAQPQAEVVTRMRRIMQTRARGDDLSSLNYWRIAQAAEPGGVMKAQEFQVWIDWLVRDGQLAPAQVNASAAYTNALNPYAKQN
jgi:ABC-type nitrate/sulfonate/bicarbonate transport system substrate-binding protein